jgi:flagellar operon protein
MKVNSGDTDRKILIPQPVGVGGSRPVDIKPGGARGVQSKPNFGDILTGVVNKSDQLKFSAHAERRLRERNVVLDREDMQKIEGAVNKAAAKGSRESLVIYGDLALVASVKNKTIITALEGKDMREHVFTNIDSAVWVRSEDTP